uniref:Uncharacterized protein n=1 Tax=Trichogramma kaykai TaxID=54128 RepID=A0ABD2WQC2_9HYME
MQNTEVRVITTLQMALFFGDWEEAEQQLRMGTDANLPNSEGMTSLHVIGLAVHEWADTFFRIMAELHRRVKVNIPNKKGRTPLHLALANDNRKVAEALLRRHADPNFADHDGYTALHVICKRDKDQGLLKEFFKIVKEIPTSVRINARDKKGNTPLHLAAAGGSLILVELLLKNQADPNSRNKEGSTPLHLICKRRVNGGLVNQFFKVALDMDLEVRINAQDKRGNSPLHLALADRCCNEYMVRVLLTKDADPNVANEQGQTPLHLVCSRYHKDNTAYEFFNSCKFEKKPLEVDAKDKKGRTPLQLAVANLLMEEVNLLSNYGADPSKFVFPSEHDFRQALGYREDDDLSIKGDRVSRALQVLEILEERGYKVDRGDAMTIGKLFGVWGFLEIEEDPANVWCKDTEPTYSDFHSSDESIKKAAYMRWFYTTTREFFQKWRIHNLEPLRKKTIKKLYILCL